MPTWNISGLESISTFWTLSNLYMLNCFKHFLIYFQAKCLKIRQERFWTISILHVLICFKYFLKYILGQKISKSQKDNVGLYQVFTHNFLCRNGKIFWAISSLLVKKCLGTSKLFTVDVLKALLSKNWLYFFSHLLACKNSTIF